MIELLAVALIVLGVISIGLRFYMRWWVRRAVSENPRVAVVVEPSASGEVTQATLTVTGTARRFHLVRLTVPREAAHRLALRPPAGFVESSSLADAPDPDGAVTWIPTDRYTFVPDQPRRLSFDHANAREPVVVRGWAEATLGLGGTGLSFPILVGETRTLALEIWNLRTALYVEAAAKEVIPRSLPGWERLEDLERQMRD